MMGKIVRFNLANSPKKFKGLRDKYAYQSNIHRLIYKGANLVNVNYRASIITNCNFKNARLTGVDFIGTNLKRTTFKGANLSNVNFFNANLKGTDFTDVVFNNVTFMSTNVEKAKNLNIQDANVKVINSYPTIKLTQELEEALYDLSECPGIYKSHVLHVQRNKLNYWFLHLLLANYSQANLISYP